MNVITVTLLVSLAAGAWAGCGVDLLATCEAGISKMADVRQLIDGYMLLSLPLSLPDACKEFARLKECMATNRETECDDVIRTAYIATRSAYTYLCSEEGLGAVRQQGACLLGPQLATRIGACAEQPRFVIAEFLAEDSHALCEQNRHTVALLNCLRESVNSTCGAGAAAVWGRYTHSKYGPLDMTQPCAEYEDEGWNSTLCQGGDCEQERCNGASCGDTPPDDRVLIACLAVGGVIVAAIIVIVVTMRLREDCAFRYKLRRRGESLVDMEVGPATS